MSANSLFSWLKNVNGSILCDQTRPDPPITSCILKIQYRPTVFPLIEAGSHGNQIP